MILILNHSNELVAREIYGLFQSSYRVEAQILGLKHFPPLSRSVRDIQNSDAIFYGHHDDGLLVGVIEIVVKNGILEIDSLTVSPSNFRQGIADKLIAHILYQFDYNKAIVETAVDNTPAIKLYKKHGFRPFNEWQTTDGINKLGLSLES